MTTEGNLELDIVKNPKNIIKGKSLLKDGRTLLEISAGTLLGKFARTFTSIIPYPIVQDLAHLALGGLIAGISKSADLKRIGFGVGLEGGLSAVGKITDRIGLGNLGSFPKGILAPEKQSSDLVPQMKGATVLADISGVGW